MCVSESDCGAQASCVAGRCVAHGATPAVSTARRLLFEPVDVGWVRRGDGAVGDVATIGRGDGAVILLRFSIALAPEASVVEAYLLLERVPGIDADPVAMTLHATRIAGAWDSRSLSWARQPLTDEMGAPVTRVVPAAGRLVRLDVGTLVQRWRRRAADDFGLAVVTEGESPTGMPIALGPVDVPADRDDPVLAPHAASGIQDPRTVAPASVGDPRRQLAGPRLELYVK